MQQSQSLQEVCSHDMNAGTAAPVMQDTCSGTCFLYGSADKKAVHRHQAALHVCFLVGSCSNFSMWSYYV